MIWDWHAPSHWVCREFAGDGHGYEIHARCRPKRGAKTIFDSIPESWVVQLSLNNKVVKRFKNQPHILDAQRKAVAYVKACLELQQKIREQEAAESANVTVEELAEFKKEFDDMVANSTVSHRVPIENPTDSKIDHAQ